MSREDPVADVPIRDAATVILIRDASGPAASVLMGQRGAKAAFMPSKFVFPGGAVDATDADIGLTGALHLDCKKHLMQDTDQSPDALATAAIREVWEETGLRLGRRESWPDPPADWATFAEGGHRPYASALRFVFRAITPPGRSRRFDARFFLCDAASVSGDLDDFSRASDELSHLAWIPIAEARSFDLPFITEVVLAEVAARLPDLSPPDDIPFFHQDQEERLFQRLKGVGPAP